MTRRPILLVLATSLALALGVVAAPPAMAGPNPLTWSVDKTVAQAGDDVTVTVTFTNPEAVPVTFSYLSVNPTFATWFYYHDFAITGCGGDVNSCWLGQPQPIAAFTTLTAPIAPGATRTFEVTYHVSATTACGAVEFFFYTYRESTAGFVGETINAPGTRTTIVC